MKRLLVGLALLALAVPAAWAQNGPGGPPPRGGGRLGGYANPSAVIAAEIAFAQLAQAKGQWTAFRETAAADAVMFAPAMVPAQVWLKNRANPPVAVAWQPHQVWSSCDGATMVTTGAWQRGDKNGWFTTVWQRQDKGGYRWVFDHGDEARVPLAAPEMIAGRVADCPERRAGERPGGPLPARQDRPAKPAKTPPVPFDPARREGRSQDGTLTWRVTAAPDGTHDFTAQLLIDGRMQVIRQEHVAGG